MISDILVGIKVNLPNHHLSKFISNKMFKYILSTWIRWQINRHSTTGALSSLIQIQSREALSDCPSLITLLVWLTFPPLAYEPYADEMLDALPPLVLQHFWGWDFYNHFLYICNFFWTWRGIFIIWRNIIKISISSYKTASPFVSDLPVELVMMKINFV